MNLTDKILGACIEPYCHAEDVAVRILDGLVTLWDRRTERVRAWLDVDRYICPELPDAEADE